MAEFEDCPRCGYPHPNCKCEMEMPNVPNQVASFADGGEVPDVAPIPQTPVSTADILSSIPEMQGSYSNAAAALNQPIHEGMLGDPELNGEHIVAHIGLENILNGKLNDGILKAANRAEDPMNSEITALGHLEKAVSNHGTNLEKEAKSIFEEKNKKADLSPPDAEEHKESVENIHNLANNPAGLINDVSDATQGAYSVAPSIAQSAQQTMIRALQFLSSKAPINNDDPLDKPLDPSAQQANTFNRYLEVVKKPLIAFDQIKNGTLLPETIETLQTVYPKLYEKMKQSVFDNLDPEMPYQKKLLVGQFIGAPLDSSLNPQNILSLQQSFGAAAKKEAAANAPKPRPSGMKEIDLASRASLAPKDSD